MQRILVNDAEIRHLAEPWLQDLDETLAGIERVTAADLERVAAGLFSDGALAGTVLGPLDGWQYPAERLRLGQ